MVIDKLAPVIKKGAYNALAVTADQTPIIDETKQRQVSCPLPSLNLNLYI